MIMGDGHLPGLPLHGGPHPLISIYEDRLYRLVGCLSSFIVHKQFQHLKDFAGGDLDERAALDLCRAISLETRLLIGPTRSGELEAELVGLTKDFFRGGS
jgi:hypothetical protein